MAAQQPMPQPRLGIAVLTADLIEACIARQAPYSLDGEERLGQRPSRPFVNLVPVQVYFYWKALFCLQ